MTAQKAVRSALDNRTIVPAFNIPFLPMVKPVCEAIRDENSIGTQESLDCLLQLIAQSFGSGLRARCRCGSKVGADVPMLFLCFLI